MRRLSWAYGSRGIVLRTLATRFLRIADRERWADLGNHERPWEQRTREIAQLIPPGTHVIEFGAGRCALRQWLSPGCTYLPSDIVPRDHPTFICDLNRRPLPELRPAPATQAAVFAGVLEYIVDVPGVIRWLAPSTQLIVASYNCAPPARSAFGRLRRATARLSAGWLNAFSYDEFIALFAEASFELIDSRTVTSEPDEYLFRFARNDGRAAVVQAAGKRAPTDRGRG